MDSKLPTVAVYLCVGLTIVGMLAAHVLGRGKTSFSGCTVSLATLSVAIVFLMGSSPSAGLYATAGALASAIACSIRWRATPRRIYWPAASVLFMTFCLAGTIAWWRRNGTIVDISWKELLALQVSLVAATLVLSGKNGRAHGDRPMWWAVCTAFLLGAIVFLFSTGLYRQPWMLWLSWHHWGAYIGPVQLARMGIPLFHDAPAQYGLGPTGVLALTCGEDCWQAMYFVAGISSLLYSLLMFSIARRLVGTDQTPLQIALVGLVTFVSLFVWTAYPPNLGSAALTPSVSGLRFLPLALLVWVLIRGNERRHRAKLPEKIHLLWLLGVLWSPESAFQVTAVWWPYYVWTRCTYANRDHLLREFLTANARLIAWLLAGGATFLLAYRFAYGLMPSADVYFAYALHPPGPLPVPLFGAIWFFGAAIVLSVVSLCGAWRTSLEDRHVHHVVVILLATYGAASYFLGRSHDNNLLNISAFFVLLLLAVRELPHTALSRVASSGMLAALLAYSMLANWNTWCDVAKSGALLEFQPAATVVRFSYMTPEGGQANQTVAGPGSPATLAADAATGMRTILHLFNEPVTVIDPALNLEASAAGDPWSAYHGPENYAYLPPALRRRFLADVARKLKMPGWLLIRKDYDATDWLADYDAVYRRDRTVTFGSYYAIRYVPRAALTESP